MFGLAFAAMRFSFYVFSFFLSFFLSFFFSTRFPPHKWLLFMYGTWTIAATCDQFFGLVFREQCIRALFMDPQISFFYQFFIKNGSYDIIYTFKNYFTTVISAINFQFQQNKSYPNRPLIKKKKKKGWGAQAPTRSIPMRKLPLTLIRGSDSFNLA